MKTSTFKILIVYFLCGSMFFPYLLRGQSIESFTLINAENGEEIGQLQSNQIVNLTALPNTNINIRANTSANFSGSVQFWYDSLFFRTENQAPYTLAGDVAGIYNKWTPAIGKHTLTAIPYSEIDANRIAGQALTVNFTVEIADTSINDSSRVAIDGELKKWHKITLTFTGPDLDEGSTPNPFLDYRLNVTFTHSSGKKYTVPGYFAADGNAAETSGSSGNKWRVHFVPNQTGRWNYTVSFRGGQNIAVNDDPNQGVAITSLNGVTDSFTVLSTDKTGKDLRAKGRLQYTGNHYLQFAETGEYFIKAGADSPENFLAYNDFDNTPDNGQRRKSWAPHLQDWRPANPAWQNGKGKGMIGAINYLAAEGMNVFSFLTMSINGDDRNVFPYVNSSLRTRFDVSKLDQWGIVFSHAQNMGMYLHFKLQETENDNLLDGGDVGTERKLYYRELIARFSHHLALNWNLGEENTQTDAQRKAMAQYIYDHDPYKHPIVLHTYPGQQESIYRSLLGDSSKLSGVSIQTNVSNVYNETRKWVDESAKANKKWVVANDEQGSHLSGVAADAEYTGNRGSVADNSESIRKNVLWANLMAGGAGVEYYFGYETGETDLTAQDFRSRAKSWRYARYALDFFESYTRFHEMTPLANLSSGWLLGNPGKEYVVYLNNGGTANINLPLGEYDVKWFNPRSGGPLQTGSVSKLQSGNVSIGNPPEDPSSDWVALIRNQSLVAPPDVVFAVNAGGEAYTAFDGITYLADTNFAGGSVYSTIDEITHTLDDSLYQTERYGNFRYSIPLSNGSYEVTLKFAEIYQIDSGLRNFDVLVENVPVMTATDLFALAGLKQAHDEVRMVMVNDSTLNIEFRTIVDNAKLSAFHVRKIGITDGLLSGSTAHALLSTPATLSKERTPIQINIYPNPSNGLINVQADAKIPYIVNVYNAQGVNLLRNTISTRQGNIDLSRYGSGIYVVEFLLEGKTLRKKVIIE